MRTTTKHTDNWEDFVEKAKSEQANSQKVDYSSDRRLNAIAAFIPPMLLLLGYLMPTFFELIAFAGWGLGAVVSLLVLAVYGWTTSVSHKAKEAALSFLLGDLLVVGLIILKPV